MCKTSRVFGSIHIILELSFDRVNVLINGKL